MIHEQTLAETHKDTLSFAKAHTSSWLASIFTGSICEHSVFAMHGTSLNLETSKSLHTRQARDNPTRCFIRLLLFLCFHRFPDITSVWRSIGGSEVAGAARSVTRRSPRERRYRTPSERGTRTVLTALNQSPDWREKRN